MGRKGDRAVKEPLALRMYAEGQNLAEIAAALDISAESLRVWKAESRTPGDDTDGWDKARAQKRGKAQRLRDLFDGQLEHVESLPKDQVSAPMMDVLAKLGALVERFEAAEADKGAVDRPKLFLEALTWLATKLRDMDPEGLKVLERNFDALIIQFKAEHA